MGMKKRLLSICLAVFLLLGTTPVFAEETLTIDLVREAAVENSDALQTLAIDRIMKEIELQQAQEGIRDIRKKENTVRFSLLFNIQFPEKHGLPKEIELVMKVPEIQKEIEVLKKKEPYETLKIQTDGEKAFYDVLLERHNEDYYEERIQDSKSVLAALERDYRKGKAKKEDVSFVKNQIEDYESSLQKTQLALDEKKKKLGSLIGTEVRTGYAFEEYYPELDIPRSELSKIIAFSLENDFNLYEKIQARKLAETDTNEILNIYKNQYSKYIGDIEAYIKSHEGKEIDYDEFIEMYQHTLTEIDSPWEGYYKIPIFFFVIKIPKEWFKGEYSGTRYMEDQKYALFVSLTERDKARKEEETARKTLEDTIYSSYSNLVQMKSAYDAAEENLQLAKEYYDSMLADNRKGLVSFTSLESSRSDYYEKQNAAYEMRLEYAKMLSDFNLTTSGYVSHLLSGGAVVDKDLDAGTSILGEAQWFLKTNLTDYTFEFSVSIPEDYGVNYYQLYYKDLAVGSRMGLDETLIHVPIAYSDSTEMEVRFYQDDLLEYVGTFDVEDYSGTFAMRPATGVYTGEDAGGTTEEVQNDGSWKLDSKDLFRSTLTVSVGNLPHTSWEAFYDGKSIGKAAKGEGIVNLSLYFSDMGNVTLKFYNGEQAALEYRAVAGYGSGDLQKI